MRLFEVHPLLLGIDSWMEFPASFNRRPNNHQQRGKQEQNWKCELIFRQPGNSGKQQVAVTVHLPPTCLLFTTTSVP
jgi:hypothetical protein